MTYAHEVRPARLIIHQKAVDTYEVFWKLPAIKEGVLKLKPVLDFDHEVLSRDPGKDLGNAYIETWSFRKGDPSVATKISIDGLTSTITDVFVTIYMDNGDESSFIVRPDQPYFIVDKPRTNYEITKDFIVLGVEHIWFGYDHLLFVLCLLWLITGFKKLVQTITAFTLAHSITLVASTLGWMTLPGPPVEAIIALSIVFLAVEIIKDQNGEEVYTSKYPWVVALTFGLLHGFGFAGALSDIGLPQSALTLSLFGFNLGVEVGQIIFVIAVILIVKVIRIAIPVIPKWSSTVSAYAIGSLAGFWLIERVLGF